MEDNKELELNLDQLNLESQYYIPVELDNLEGIKFDKKLFDKGLKDYSYLAGGISALINAGMSAEMALQYFINERTCQHNIELQKIVNDNNIQIAQIQEVKVQGQTL